MAELLPDKELSYQILAVPPATGAVLWALSLTGRDPFTPEIATGFHWLWSGL